MWFNATTIGDKLEQQSRSLRKEENHFVGRSRDRGAGMQGCHEPRWEADVIIKPWVKATGSFGLLSLVDFWQRFVK